MTNNYPLMPNYPPPAGSNTASLWENAKDIIDKIFDHPFCRGLSDGTLPESCFKHYLAQDMLYIRQDARAFAILAGRAVSDEEFSFFLAMAKDGLDIERALHNELFPVFQIEKADKMSDTCRRYTAWLTEVSLSGAYSTATAALLPCFWVYHETGIRIRQNAVKNNPYQKWLDTYSGEEYGGYVEKYLHIVENIMKNSNTTQKHEMINAFRKSTQYELDFFSEAWDIRNR
jgi:thiaminase/transcriptional activator TenA